MFPRLVRKHWQVMAGTASVLAVIASSMVFLGQDTVDSLVEANASEKARLLSDHLSRTPAVLDALLTGLTRDPDIESDAVQLAALAGIANFGVFDRDGIERFSARSDRYAWLLRDRPGGTVTGERIGESLVGDPAPWRHVVRLEDGSVRVVLPLDHDGVRAGYLSASIDVGDVAGVILATIRTSTGSLMVVVGFSIGIPLLIYLRRKRRIEQADEKIDFLANYDSLTHLLNRRRMQQETDRILATSRATRERMGFWQIDVEGLADVNSVHGQEAGDELLRTIASRLMGALDRHDLLARLGADDFVILQRHVGDMAAFDAYCKRIVQAVQAPVEIGAQNVVPRLHMGLAMVPDHGRTFTHLVRQTELAVTVHKSSKQNDYTMFDVTIDEEAHSRREIENRIRHAVDTNSFELFYQPIVSGDGQRPVGFEALIRLADGRGGYISPAVFIPIAEARGYIKAIGNWVIEEAVRQIAQWPCHLTIAVNLSAVQFRDGDLVRIVEDALSAAQVPGHRLEIEVVESLLLDRSDAVLDQLKGLKALGVSIAMDDFGTGYSSLGYLWRFPFDKLKIDQSFMVAYEQGEPNVPQILETIITLAHHMDMRVTTEGVETAAQMELLTRLGCDTLQGYHFGKPMPSDRVAPELLQRHAARERARAEPTVSEAVAIA